MRRNHVSNVCCHYEDGRWVVAETGCSHLAAALVRALLERKETSAPDS